ncbi:MAG: type II toxin-antitoxin system Phd/YefM family antitoxin [Thermomicrobiales bacterium]|nr:type II toxin-antitoxin system Phd/YefM family antitoxin [Thermomicrobiales bacterium]MCO5223119.1 type II toxin-antitoxin system Phd/YefM family antitoxin [Thermomicrobiales bacterium]
MSSIPTETLKFTEARPKLSSILDRVFRRETRIRLYKGSTPVAAIVSIEDLEALEDYERRREQAFINIGKIAEGFRDVTPEEFDRQLELAKAEIRAERKLDHVSAGNA